MGLTHKPTPYYLFRLSPALMGSPTIMPPPLTCLFSADTSAIRFTRVRLSAGERQMPGCINSTRPTVTLLRLRPRSIPPTPWMDWYSTLPPASCLATQIRAEVSIVSILQTSLLLRMGLTLLAPLGLRVFQRAPTGGLMG